jgi:hypothetical protein
MSKLLETIMDIYLGLLLNLLINTCFNEATKDYKASNQQGSAFTR